MILHGDSLHILKTLEANSVDSIVTDPPYGLRFMGKKWDYDVPAIEIWKECLRVLKPGGHLLSFGGTRTYHRMVVNIEDAGFEIRDQIMWIYGSGFPKSTDVSKRIDREAGAEREVVGINKNHRSLKETNCMVGEPHSGDGSITVPSTDAAKQYQGWGTALKPANEPIVMARKPLEHKLTVAANVLKYGTGGLNIDASRIGTSADMNPNDFDDSKRSSPKFSGKFNGGEIGDFRNRTGAVPNGRWPANILFDEQAAQVLDIQAEGTSRFFYVAKASKRERGEGNNHPTVKPIKLMQYLITLVTPPGGIVLDPFAGSGSTGVACKSLGFEFIGIELNKEYVEIAEKRCEAFA